jgi:hypothetical protein
MLLNGTTRVETRRFQSYGSTAFNLYSPHLRGLAGDGDARDEQQEGLVPARGRRPSNRLDHLLGRYAVVGAEQTAAAAPRGLEGHLDVVRCCCAVGWRHVAREHGEGGGGGGGGGCLFQGLEGMALFITLFLQLSRHTFIGDTQCGPCNPSDTRERQPYLRRVQRLEPFNEDIRRPPPACRRRVWLGADTTKGCR